ncbi:MAG: hypothetical protein PF904_00975 [Kiritimatiellae bacterium]|nr:hypothetical protein [Kiritimatiellia bacterium]
MSKKCNMIMNVILCVLFAGVLTALGGSNPYRGLWVGQAKLNFVNEVSIPLDEDNVPIAPDPNVPTPTSDQAQIRVILHVNGAGQVNLLKDVAILKRSDEGETNQLFSSEADFSLVTDERLYEDFPVQEAKRIASAVFDFGDIKATEAVDAIVLKISSAVAKSIVDTVDETTAENAAIAAANDVVPNADVAETFDAFLKDKLPKNDVTALAEANGVGIDALRPEAQILVDQSFYNDTRTIDVLDSLATAIADATPPAEKTAAAQNAVARFADVNNLFERFVHGLVFGDMIREVALAAATQAAVSGSTHAVIDSQSRVAPAYIQAAIDALNAKVSAYTDTASSNALESVVSGIVDSAYLASTSGVVVVNALAAQLESDGFSVLAELQQGMVSVDIPSTDYSEFVRSQDFSDAVSIAAAAAAKAAVAETNFDPFYTEFSLEGQARIAATLALKSVYSEAGRARQTELPLDGSFAAGSGDARFLSLISSTDAPLGGAGLTGTIILPANHPTNPFRHRRHPDHTIGFNIERRLRFDFDGASTNALERTGLGVERITGVYREEFFGLHKSLGPEPSTSPIGLKVEGSFELNRISLIDTLNAR